MKELFTETIVPAPGLWDEAGHPRPSRLLTLLQEGAARHVSTFGYDSDTLAGQHCAWVVTRQGLTLLQPCPPDTPLTLCTWMGEGRHGLYPRYYELSAGEAVFLRGWALWALMDLQSRTMLLPDQSGVTLPGIVTGRESAPGRIRPGQLPHAFSFTVPASYADRNGHTNNARYLDMAQAHLPVENRGWRSFSVDYRAETLPGDTLTVAWGEENGLYTLRGTRDGTLCFLLQVEYE